jgi:uncharacterized protein
VNVADTGSLTGNRDAALLRSKVNSARKYFEATWADFFRQRRAPYASPPLIGYQKPISTSCGVLPLGNAGYCPPANAIYYDEGFLTALMKRVAAETHTDGDYAPITVLAHEWGHAVQRWLEQSSPGALRQQYEFFREQEADCFAGAITRMAEKSGYLEAGDLEEARHALALGADKGFYGLAGHGNPVERIGSFNRGYQKGVNSCDVALDPDWWHHAVEDWRKAWDHRSFNDMLKDPKDQPTLGPKPYDPKRRPFGDVKTPQP